MRRNERGVTLLEVMIALGVILTAGLSVMARVESGSRTAAEVLGRERELRTASRVMAAMTLLKRIDLDRRLGTHQVGEFLVEVQRPEPALYRIALRETRAPGVEMLVTVVFRPSAADGVEQ